MRFAQLRQRVVLSMALCAAGTSIHAQQAANHPATTPQAAQPERFEVASVRLSPPEIDSAYVSIADSRLTVKNFTLKFISAIAYGISDTNVLNGPKWFDEQLYQIEAKAPDGPLLTGEQMRPMIQNLLIDRFHMQAHRETQMRSGYALIVAKNGSKLNVAKPIDPNDYKASIYKNRLLFSSSTMKTLAETLARVVGQPIADKTEIKGSYRIDFEFSSLDDTDSGLPSIFTALSEKLGLKLVPDKQVPVEVLIVDAIDRTPTEN